MENIIEREEAFLDTCIFYGLQNLNDGFDAPTIKYFREDDFEEVLNRVKEHGLGILGIEPWKNGGFYRVMVYEDFTDDPADSNWYMQAFEKFKGEKEELRYGASYFIPAKILK